MQKCRRCGGAMLPQEIGKRLMLVCNSCGYREQANKDDKRKISARDADVIVVEKKIELAPTTHAICPSCGADRAYWWIRQTRAADEPSTRFYKCVKCGKVWREYV